MLHLMQLQQTNNSDKDLEHKFAGLLNFQGVKYDSKWVSYRLLDIWNKCRERERNKERGGKKRVGKKRGRNSLYKCPHWKWQHQLQRNSVEYRSNFFFLQSSDHILAAGYQLMLLETNDFIWNNKRIMKI